jgi:hypothetical protein
MPFALWGAGDLLHAARSVPEVPEQMMDEVWRRLVQSIPSLAGAGAAAAIAAAKAGAVLTARQAAVGAVAALLMGAGLHALLGPAIVGGRRAPEVVAVAHHQAPVTVTTASVTTAEPVATVAVVPSASALVDAGVAPTGDGMDRTWLKNARDAYERGDFDAARRALGRVKGSHLAREREELRQLLPPPAGRDGGT